MKYLLLLILLFSVVILNWCSYDKQKEKRYMPVPEAGKNSFLLQDKEQESQPKDISLNWLISSWNNIEEDNLPIYKEWIIWSFDKILWKHNTLLQSWNTFQYWEKYSFNNLNMYHKWNYNLHYMSELSWYYKSWYQERFTILNDDLSKNINIAEITRSYLYYVKPSNSSDKELCTPSYEEWINYKPKTIEKTLWGKKIYITYATFSVSAPDTKPFKNYQAEICFVQDDKIYTITIGDTKQYRKDIVESFRFL